MSEYDSYVSASLSGPPSGCNVVEILSRHVEQEITYFENTQRIGLASALCSQLVEADELAGEQLDALLVALQRWLTAGVARLTPHEPHWWDFVYNVSQIATRACWYGRETAERVVESLAPAWLHAVTVPHLDYLDLTMLLVPLNDALARTHHSFRLKMMPYLQSQIRQLVVRMSQCGQHGAQAELLACVVKFMPRCDRTKRDIVRVIFPRELYNDQSATDAFCENDFTNFLPECREFLCKFNNVYNGVVNFICESAYVDDIRLLPIGENEDDSFWVDLNMGVRSLTLQWNADATRARCTRPLYPHLSGSCATLTVDEDLLHSVRLTREGEKMLLEVTAKAIAILKTHLFPKNQIGVLKLYPTGELDEAHQALAEIFGCKYRCDVPDVELRAPSVLPPRYVAPPLSDPQGFPTAAPRPPRPPPPAPLRSTGYGVRRYLGLEKSSSSVSSSSLHNLRGIIERHKPTVWSKIVEKNTYRPKIYTCPEESILSGKKVFQKQKLIALPKSTDVVWSALKDKNDEELINSLYQAAINEDPKSSKVHQNRKCSSSLVRYRLASRDENNALVSTHENRVPSKSIYSNKECCDRFNCVELKIVLERIDITGMSVPLAEKAVNVQKTIDDGELTRKDMLHILNDQIPVTINMNNETLNVAHAQEESSSEAIPDTPNMETALQFSSRIFNKSLTIPLQVHEMYSSEKNNVPKEIEEPSVANIEESMLIKTKVAKKSFSKNVCHISDSDDLNIISEDTEKFANNSNPNLATPISFRKKRKLYSPKDDLRALTEKVYADNSLEDDILNLGNRETKPVKDNFTPYKELETENRNRRMSTDELFDIVRGTTNVVPKETAKNANAIAIFNYSSESEEYYTAPVQNGLDSSTEAFKKSRKTKRLETFKKKVNKKAHPKRKKSPIKKVGDKNKINDVLVDERIRKEVPTDSVLNNSLGMLPLMQNKSDEQEIIPVGLHDIVMEEILPKSITANLSQQEKREKTNKAGTSVICSNLNEVNIDEDNTSRNIPEKSDDANNYSEKSFGRCVTVGKKNKICMQRKENTINKAEKANKVTNSDGDFLISYKTKKYISNSAESSHKLSETGKVEIKGHKNTKSMKSRKTPEVKTIQKSDAINIDHTADIIHAAQYTKVFTDHDHYNKTKSGQSGAGENNDMNMVYDNSHGGALRKCQQAIQPKDSVITEGHCNSDLEIIQEYSPVTATKISMPASEDVNMVADSIQSKGSVLINKVNDCRPCTLQTDCTSNANVLKKRVNDSIHITDDIMTEEDYIAVKNMSKLKDARINKRKYEHMSNKYETMSNSQSSVTAYNNDVKEDSVVVGNKRKNNNMKRVPSKRMDFVDSNALNKSPLPPLVIEVEKPNSSLNNSLSSVINLVHKYINGSDTVSNKPESVGSLIINGNVTHNEMEPRQERCSLTDTNSIISNEKSIGTNAGTPITAHGDFNERPPNVTSLDKTESGRGLDMDGFDEKEDRQFIQDLRSSVQASTKVLNIHFFPSDDNEDVGILDLETELSKSKYRQLHMRNQRNCSNISFALKHAEEVDNSSKSPIPCSSLKSNTSGTILFEQVEPVRFSPILKPMASMSSCNTILENVTMESTPIIHCSNNKNRQAAGSRSTEQNDSIALSEFNIFSQEDSGLAADLKSTRELATNATNKKESLRAANSSKKQKAYRKLPFDNEPAECQNDDTLMDLEPAVDGQHAVSDVCDVLLQAAETGIREANHNTRTKFVSIVPRALQRWREVQQALVTSSRKHERLLREHERESRERERLLAERERRERELLLRERERLLREYERESGERERLLRKREREGRERLLREWELERAQEYKEIEGVLQDLQKGVLEVVREHTEQTMVRVSLLREDVAAILRQHNRRTRD